MADLGPPRARDPRTSEKTAVGVAIVRTVTPYGCYSSEVRVAEQLRTLADYVPEEVTKLAFRDMHHL